MMRYIKRHILLALVLCCFTAFAPEYVLAHRVNVFAYVEGNSVQVECAFSKSNRVREGKLFFLDRETQSVVHEATTDEQGCYTLKAGDIAPILDAGHGLLIRLVAGEGHQNEWEMDAEELAPLAVKSAAREASQAPGVPEAAAQAPAVTPEVSSRILKRQADSFTAGKEGVFLFLLLLISCIIILSYKKKSGRRKE